MFTIVIWKIEIDIFNDKFSIQFWILLFCQNAKHQLKFAHTSKVLKYTSIYYNSLFDVRVQCAYYEMKFNCGVISQSSNIKWRGYLIVTSKLSSDNSDWGNWNLIFNLSVILSIFRWFLFNICSIIYYYHVLFYSCCQSGNTRNPRVSSIASHYLILYLDNNNLLFILGCEFSSVFLFSSNQFNWNISIRFKGIIFMSIFVNEQNIRMRQVWFLNIEKCWI